MIKRTPPTTPVNNALSAVSENESIKVTQRRKKGSDERSEQLPLFMKEVKNMTTNLKLEQDMKFDSLNSAITEIKSQNTEIQKCIEFVSQKYDETA
ncbi:hypothetical protein EVAR_69665_1 [Eumeta japonica]|uniref:Uncharacterized protein n=1 Tax=Eumeta variegata TaxID=151549 RepID=A0A4C1ZLM1_EUMVA|nr:hypothetical protein EVAR_69665_1 [Eumeta japonica]